MLLAGILTITSVVPAQASSLFSDDDYVTLQELQESTEEKDDSGGVTRSSTEDNSDIDTSKVRKSKQKAKVEEGVIEGESEEEETITKSAKKKDPLPKDMQLNTIDQIWKGVGQYTINYVGNVNFKDGPIGDKTYPVKYNLKNDDQFKNVYRYLTSSDSGVYLDTITGDNDSQVYNDNGSAALYKKTAGATKIVKAYLIWQTSVQGRYGKCVDENDKTWWINETDALDAATSEPVYLSISPKGYISVGKTDYKAFSYESKNENNKPGARYVDNRKIYNGQKYNIGNFGETIYYPREDNGEPDYSRPPRGQLMVKGKSADISQYTMSCMYTDVTEYVVKQAEKNGGSIDEFKVAVMGIPYAKTYLDKDEQNDMLAWDADSGSHGGESIASWQLVVVEENPTVKAHAVSLNVGSVFDHIPMVNSHTGKQVLTAVPLTSTISLNGFNSVSNTKDTVEGQELYVGIGAGIPNTIKYSLQGKNGADVSNKTFKNIGLKINGSVTSNGASTANYEAPIVGDLWKFSTNDDNAYGQSKFDVKITPKDAWSTLCVLGAAVELADYDISQGQETKANGNKFVVSDTIKVAAKEDGTGYNSGKLVVSLDKNIEATSAEFTVKSIHDEATTKYTLASDPDNVKYDKSKNTVTLMKFNSSGGKIRNVGNGSTISYKVYCKRKSGITDWNKNSDGKPIVKNSHQLTGKLTVDGKDTDLAKTHPESKSSAEVPNVLTGPEGYFWVNINPDESVGNVDNAKSKVKVCVQLDKGLSPTDPTSVPTKAKIWIDDSASTNNHDIKLSGAGKDGSVTVEMVAGSTSDPLDRDGNESFKHSSGTTVYKSKNKLILKDIPIEYTVPAYLYVSGTEIESVGTNYRSNSRPYAWQNYNTDDDAKYKPTLRNEGTHTSPFTDKFTIQTNLRNVGIDLFGDGVAKNTNISVTLSRAKLVLIYNGNRGATQKTGGKSTQTFYYYADDTLGEAAIYKNSTTKFTLTDNAFKTWNGKADGTGKEYEPGTKYTASSLKSFSGEGDPSKLTQSKEIYAQWGPDTIHVRYHQNGETKFYNGGNGDWKGHDKPAASGCETNKHYKKNVAWYMQYTKGSGSSAKKTDLVAKRSLSKKTHEVGSGSSKKSYTCYYNLGSPEEYTGSFKIGDSIDLLNTDSCLDFNDGYQATGYWRVGKGTSKTKISYDSLTGDDAEDAFSTLLSHVSKDSDGAYYVDLYADWEGKPYTLTFDPNGGALPKKGKKKITIVHGSSDNNNVSWNKPTRDGYDFLGWYSAAKDGKQVYDEKGACTNEGTYWSNNVCVAKKDYTVYAHWKPKYVKVKYDYVKNGGYQQGTGNGIYTEKVFIGDSMTDRSDAEKSGDTGVYSATNSDGWQFVGWNTDPNATVAISRIADVNDTAHKGHVDDDVCITLYAIYKKDVDAHFISYEYGGSDDGNIPEYSRRSTDLVSTVYNNGTLATFTCPNAYTITGWAADGWLDTATAITRYNGSIYVPATCIAQGSMISITETTSYYAQYHKDISCYFVHQNKIERRSGIIYRNSYHINWYDKTIMCDAPSQGLKNGWTAAGWTTSADCRTTNQVQNDGQHNYVIATEGAVYYGLYEKDVHISYDSNGYDPVSNMPGVQTARAYFTTASWDYSKVKQFERPSYKNVLSNDWLNVFFRDGTGYSKPVDVRKITDRGYEYPSITVANTVPVYRKINQRETDVIPTFWSTQKTAPSNDTVVAGEWPEQFDRRVNCNPEGVYEFREDTLLYQQYKPVTMPEDKKIHQSVSLLTGDSTNVGNYFKSDYFSDLGRVYVSPDHSIATVEENGKITGRGSGVTLVKVYTSDGKTEIGDCKVIVSSCSVKIPNRITLGEKAEVEITARSGEGASVTAALSMDAVSALRGREYSKLYSLHSYFENGKDFKEINAGNTILKATSSNGKPATDSKVFYVMPDVNLQSLKSDVYDATIVWQLHLNLE